MITISDKALAEFRRRAAAEANGGHLVRLGVKEGGCSGLSYVITFGGEEAPGDESFVQGEFTILVDPESLRVLRGLEVDFIDSLVGGGFRFSNPNATGSCGCGSSFKVTQQLESRDPKTGD